MLKPDLRSGWRSTVSIVSMVLILTAFATVSSAADIRYEARLILPDETPAAGYSVTVVGRPLVAACDADGRFVLDPAPDVPFLVVATGPQGSASAPIEVTSFSQTELRIPEVVRDSVTVVSGIAPSLETLAGNAATMIGVEELEQRAPERLVQALESVAGASKLGDGADAVPALRGLARGRTLILLDGARVTAERRAGPSATFVEPASLASIEILRGPGSVVYGSDAFGGVINAITRDPEPGDFNVRLELEAHGGALDQQSAYAAASTPLAGGQLQIEGHAVDADNAEAGDGIEIFNSSFRGLGGALRWVRQGVAGGRLRLGLAIDRVEDIGKAAIDSRERRGFYPEENADRLTLSWLGAIGPVWDSVEASAFLGSYSIILHRDRMPTATSNRRIDISDTDSDDASLRFVAGRELAGGRLQVGLDSHSRFNLRSLTGRVSYDDDAVTVVGVENTASIDGARQFTSGLFATWNKPLSSWSSLGLGLRGDYIESRNSGGFFGDQNDQQTPVSGNVALTFGPFSNLTSTLQVARGFRVATLSNRYFRGPSGRGFVTGNPDLQPEKSTQFDLAVRYGKARRAIAFYAYRYEIDELVERFSVDRDFFFRNRGKATIQGVELEAQVTLADHWSSELGVAVTDGEADGGDNIDDMPATNGWLSLRRSFSRGYVYSRATSFLDKDDPGPNELVRPGFTIFDLGGGFRFNDRVELRAVVRNLGDKQVFASPDDAADRAVGRSFTLGLSSRF